ncbi:MAG: thiamine pyrophosphate-dependent dehydrogenase E1 component subunit alpha [Gammaproteobacteria bacterium]|nr:thiamine pyrophosphate-dependent dehydrogenase E1 component subunit alpha [Gammaproteobacteria bacterium]
MSIKTLDIAKEVFDGKGGAKVALPKELTKSALRDLLVHMVRVRCIDQRMLKLQRAGRIGFVGSMLGMEAAMIGTAAGLRQQDWMWSGLREGGAALMRGLPLSEYIAQMYCNSNDSAKGRQMNNHFQHKGSHYPSWSSVIGTQIPHGVGAAFAAKRAKKDEVHGIYFGDGATSSNGFHSGMNMAAVWKAPAIFVCVNNGWAISVPSCNQTAAASYADKAIGYGMAGYDVDGNDVLACYLAMKVLVEQARKGGGPSLLVVNTYRMMGHSSSDDPSKYRDAKEVEMWQKRDPIDRFNLYLVKQGIIKTDELAAIEAQIYQEIDDEIHVQEAAPAMPLKSLVEDIYAEMPRHLMKQYNDFIRIVERYGEAEQGDGAFPL